MPEQKRPRGSSGRSSSGRPKSRSTSSRSSKPAAGRRKPAAPKRKQEELEPLDLSGTDFEELLEAGAARDDEDLEDVDDLDEDELEEDDDTYSDLRASSRLKPVSQEQGDLAARFGSYQATSGDDPIVAPWAPEQAGVSPAPVGDDEDTSKRDEMVVGGFALLLIILTAAMPWYVVGPRQLTGLAAGGFAIIPLVAAVGALITVAMKLTGRTIRFPVERGMMLEVLGYLAVGGTVLARIIRPDGANLYGSFGYPTLIAMGAGIGLAWFASRLSHGAPLVLRPGWMKESGGRAGAALLASMVALGAVLWFLEPFDSTPQARSINDSLTYTKNPPSCFTENEFPLPPALVIDEKGFFKYDLGENPVVEGDFCGVEFYSDLTVKKLRDKMRNQLKRNGWKFSLSGAAGGMPLIQLTKPACGTMSFFNQGNSEEVEYRTRGSVQIVPCQSVGGVPGQ